MTTRLLAAGLLALSSFAGGCASGSNSSGPGSSIFTLLNDSSASLEIEMLTLAGQPTLSVAPGGATTSSIDPQTDTSDGVLSIVVIPMDADSGRIGRPIRADIQGEPYSVRLFGTAAALRWARVLDAPSGQSAELTPPPPPNPGAAIQAR